MTKQIPLLVGLLFASMFLSACSSSATTVGRLRCEYLDNPLGIDTTRPRLSWELASDERGQSQSAYRVLVASTPEKLAQGEGDLWDSGKVASGETAQVEYGGKALTSRQGCYWTVTSWDQAGKASGPIAPAQWEMGLLSAGDWGAKWIGPAADQLNAPAPMLRRTFDIKGDVRRARVYVSGLGYYDLSINGQPADATRRLDPGYTRYDKRVLYSTYDVTRELKQGGNALGMVLGTGWYDVHTNAVWDFEKAPWRAAPKMLLRLDIDYADGRHEIVVSDADWKLSTGPITFDSIYGGEFYDARLEKDGWDTPTYDDSNWKPANVVDAPNGRLVAQQMPPIRICDVIKPKNITQPKPGVFVVDMGQNFSGVPQLMVSGPAGTTIKMRCGERLKPDGTLETKEIDVYVKQRGADQAFQEARYTLKGKGTETYSPRFTYYGFQYVEVTGFPGTPAVDNFRGLVVHTDVSSAGQFACSNPVLNWIERAARWSYLSNLMSIPTDCPQREKNGWTGDAHLAAEMGLYNFDSGTVYAKWLNDFDDAQATDGSFPGIIPSGSWGYGKNIGPAWDTAFFHLPYYLYLYNGDPKPLADHYDNLVKYVNYVTANRDADGTVSFGLGDWAPYEAQTPFPLTSTAYFYRDLVILSDAAKLLGKSDDAKKYADLAESTKSAFNKKFFDPAKNTYANGTQTALSCALYQHLVPAGHEQAVFDNLVKAIEAKNNHLDCGILGTKYVPNVLLDHGRADLAYRIATQTDMPSWAYWMKEKGATTLYESWKDVDSRNHIMFGDISAWFFRALAGIRPDVNGPGFKSVTIRPQVVGDLTHASATYHSVRGPITSSWTLKDGTLDLTVSIPPNVTATVYMPTADAAKVTESGKPAGKADGVHPAGTVDGAAVYTIGSGTYHFVAPQRSGR